MPYRGELEIDEQALESDQFLAGRPCEREVIDRDLQQERVDADFAHRGRDADTFRDVLEHGGTHQFRRDHEARYRIQGDEHRDNDETEEGFSLVETQHRTSQSAAGTTPVPILAKLRSTLVALDQSFALADLPGSQGIT